MSSSPKFVLITGCSRGIGLGLVREFLKRDFRILATCRNPDSATELRSVLEKAAQSPPIRCDVASDESVVSCFKAVSAITPKLDLLINNAGISNRDHPDEPPSAVQRQEMLDIFNTNVAGVCAMTQAFLPLLHTGKVLNISSGMGSISGTASITATSYRCSKAALNMLTKMFAIENPTIAFASVHPCWVQTDMGGSKGRKAPVTIEESAEGIATVAANLTIEQSGAFINKDGDALEY